MQSYSRYCAYLNNYIHSTEFQRSQVYVLAIAIVLEVLKF